MLNNSLDMYGGDVATLTRFEGEIKPENLLDDYVPEGWVSAEAFLEHVRKEYNADERYDSKNREAALEDLKFVAGDQWDDVVAADRKAKGRPCMTINVLPQFIGQVVGDRRMNETTIKVRPLRDATMDTAEIRSGIIKGIEYQSRASRVYDDMCEDQVSCGISNFRVDLDYAFNDVFDQDIIIRHIPNPLAVIWDRMSIDITGRDARHCFVTDSIPKDIYEERFGDKNPCPSPLGGAAGLSDWISYDTVRVTEFWEMVEKPATFALMQSGEVRDVTDMELEEYHDELWFDPKTQQPRIRKSFKTFARMHLVTGFAILTEAYELPLTRLPIIKVEGRVVRVGEQRVRYSLIRFAKDSQRLKNFWRSVAAERLAMAPKAYWSADSEAVKGREKEWRSAHLTGETLLIYNKGQEKPERIEPPDVPGALIQESQMNHQDIKDTTGLQDASLGMRSNEISGRAIKARQSEGDVATVIFHDNVNASIQEGGDVVNQLIDVAYDAVRTVRVIGPDDKHTMTTINDPSDPDSPDMTRGKYDIQLETGPSFTTQRQEALDAMMTLIQTSPELMQVIGDLVAKNMDWPGAYEIAQRLHRMVPAQLLGPDEQQEQQQQQQQQVDPHQQMMAQGAQELQMAQLKDAMDQVEHAQQMRQIEMATAQANLGKAQGAASTESARANAAEFNALDSQFKSEKSKSEAAFYPAKEVQKMHLADRGMTAKEAQTVAGIHATHAKTAQQKKDSAGSRPAGGNNPPRRPKPGANKGK